jgi:hypothetical protein
VKTLFFCQLGLLVYHQITTLLDFYPFNGARNYTWKEKLAEAGGNFIPMSLAPIGFGFHIRGLMIFGVVYYFFLFAVEIIIWWIPCLTTPTGRWRRIYNRMLACSTSCFKEGDTLDHWCEIYNRLHRGTITVLPARGNRPVPNLEHMILHAWTLVTAIVTAGEFFHFWKRLP